jgi:hypothetical protein
MYGRRGAITALGRTSPSNLRILKLRLLIFNVGDPGKQLRQFPRDVKRSMNTCAILTRRETAER